MNEKKIKEFLSQYSKKKDIYEDFARDIKKILKTILIKNSFMYQHIPYRVKDIKSLEKKLKKNENLKDIKNVFEVKDLAGCRVIFYLNSDIEKLAHDIYREFDIVSQDLKYSEYDYNAAHFVIKLKEDRLKLTEYSQYRGMLCEIQLTIVLFHAWSEMAHDTIYKDEERLSEFDSESFLSLEKSLQDIMSKHLKSASYQFEHFYKEFEKLKTGKKIFSQQFFDEIISLNSLNKIYERLEILYKYLQDYSDDKIPQPFNLLDLTQEILKKSRSLKKEPIIYFGGEIIGYDFKDICRVLIDILDLFRYKYTDEILEILFELSLDDDENVREKSLETIKKIPKYNLGALNKIGYLPQSLVLKKIEHFDDLKLIRYTVPICELIKELLGTEFEGQSMTDSKTLTLSFGPLSINQELIFIRKRSLGNLKRLYKKTGSINLKVMVIDSLGNATLLPSRGDITNEMKKMVIDNTNFIIDFYLSILEHTDVEVIRNIDEQIQSYQRELNIEELINLRKVQEIINSNGEYSIYKVLVGYVRGYFGSNYDEEQKYREEKIQEFVNDISLDNFELWEKRIISVTQKQHTEFYYFLNFLNLLGQQKPEIAFKLIHITELKDYIVPLVSGIWLSELKSVIKKVVEEWIKNEINISACLGVFAAVSEVDIKMINAIFKIAKKNNNLDILNSIVSIIILTKSKSLKNLFLKAIKILTANNNCDWLRQYFGNANVILSDLNENEGEIILKNLLLSEKISYKQEEILKVIAKKNFKQVIIFFYKRITFGRNKKFGSRYDPIPFSLDNNLSILLKDKNSIELILEWFDIKDGYMNIRAADFIKNIFPEFDELLEVKLISIINSGKEKDLYKVFYILDAYEGKEILFCKDIGKVIIKKYYKNSKVKKSLMNTLSRTGTVSGEYGFVESFKRKKELLQKWKEDENLRINNFVEEFKNILDKRILFEKKSADEEIIERKLEFGENIDSENN